MRSLRLPVALAALVVLVSACGGGCGEQARVTPAQGPLITAVLPAQGPTAGGSVILVKGERFAPEATVTVGGKTAESVTIADAQTLTIVVPPGDAEGGVDVQVANPDGNVITFTKGFTYTSAEGDSPTLTQLVPNQGPVPGSALIELRGDFFQADSFVFIGGRPAQSVTFISPQLLTAVTPAGTGAGGVEAAVTNPDGRSARLANGYAYSSPTAPGPRVSAIAPAQGSVLGGEEIRITGADFQTGVRLYIGGRPATGVTLIGNELVALTPPGKAGLQDVAVVNPDGQTAIQPRAYNFFSLPPRITAITPFQGPKEGGTEVVLTGRGFDSNVNVLIDGVPVNGLSIVDSESATAKTPAGARGGYVDVKIVGKDALADTAKGGFYYIDADHPPIGGTVAERVSVIRVSPSSGPSSGGTAVTILGTGFKAGASVNIGGKAANDVHVLSSTAITCKTPSGTVGPALAEVVNPDNQKGSLQIGFTYYGAVNPASAPTLSGIAPNTGPTAGGTRALLSGANFKAGVRVFLGNVEATNVVVISQGQLTFTTPSVTDAAAVNVTVLTPDGLSGQLAGGFVYYVLTSAQQQNAPALNDVSPSAGPAGVQTQVTLTGDKFQAGAVIFFGSDPAVTSTVETATGIKATTPAGNVGAVDVTITNPDGLSVTKNAGYNFAPPAPLVSSITPDKGPLAGGLTVLIVGTGFVNGAEVLFGSTPSSNVSITDGIVIRALVPPGAAGTVDVTVRNPDSQQFVKTGSFTYDPNWTQLPSPSLDQILPSRGPSTGGTVALLRGQNFADGMKVFFGNAEAQDVVVASATEASTKAPPSAEGPVHVSVVNPDGQTSVLSGGFTYVNPATLGPVPKLTGVTPTSGPESAATNVLVTGQNLKPNAYIYFGGVLAKNPVLLSATIYSAQAQPHDSGQVPVAITLPDGQSHILPNGFTYVPKPTVSGTLPQSGKSSGGTNVTLSGTGFQSGATVTFGGAAATAVTVASSTLITCTTPSGAAGAVDVKVKNPDNQQGVLVGGFTYVPPPSFSTANAVTPAQGPTTGGSIIELHGDGFQNGATVNVRGTAAQVQYVDGDTLVISTPAGAVGTADVTITNPDGQTVTLTGAFIYKDPASLGAPPTLAAPTPAVGPAAGNSRILINGGSFVDGARVFFGMLPGSSTQYVNASKLATSTPQSAAGKVVLAVTNPDGQTARLTDGFEFKAAGSQGAAPTVSLITPQSASRFGGTSISVDGTNFGPGAQLFLGGLPATNVTLNGTTQLNAIAPAHEEGPALVEVTNADGQTATFSGTFSFIIPPPQLTNVNPSGGPTQGGTTVDVNGSDLHPNAVVTFGSATASCTWVSALKLTCTTPAGSNGPVLVKVTNPDGKFAQLAGGFTYAAPPQISGVSPTSGPEAGGTRITLTGQNFKSNSVVQVGTVAATNVTFVSATALQADTPPGTGPAAVKVTNPDGQVATLAGGFTYLPPVPAPSITGLSPNYGVDTGGTNVTITGTSFQAGAQVYFGATVAPTVQVYSPTYINAVAPAGAVGTVDVKVVNPDLQQAIKTAAFTYVAQGQLPPLAVDSVSPGRGPTAGGNVVTVLGRGFKVGAIVAIGGNTCSSPQYIGPGAINCTVPAGAAGPTAVTVTNPGGPSVTLNGGYIYGDGGAFQVTAQRMPSESRGGKYDSVLIDADGDSDLDNVVFFDAYTRVQWNDGTGTFTENSVDLFTTNRYFPQFWLATPPVDVTGDGRADLILKAWEWTSICGTAPNQYRCGGQYFGVNVFKNNGGTFTWLGRVIDNDQTFLNGPIVMADVDNDGDKDMVLGRDTNEVLYKNNGAGSFTVAANAFPNLSDATRAICVGDVDKDGDQDVFVANDLDQQKRLYLNNGSGAFTDVSATHLSALGGNSYGCAIGDIDKDNDLDIFIINNGQQDRLYVNDGTGHFADGTTGRMPAEVDQSKGAELIDIDFDGDKDLISYLPTAKTERVYLSDGNGQFVAANTDLIPAVVGPSYWNRYGDLNGDGFPDMIRTHNGGQDRVYLNQSNGQGGRTFVDKTMISFPNDWRTHTASTFFDIDGDGDKDLITGETWNIVINNYYYAPWYGTFGCSSQQDGRQYDGQLTGRLHVYLNDGAGNFFENTATKLSAPNLEIAADRIAVADFDGVNGLDFAVNDKSAQQRVRLFLNDGSGYFTESSYPNLPNNSYQFVGALTASDLDKDGRIDLLAGTRTGVRFWRNIGSGYFVDISSTTMPSISNGYPGWVTDIDVGDLDGDNDLDLFVSRYCGAQVIKNETSGFVDYTSLKMPSAAGAYEAHLFDADNDNDLDAFVVNCTDDRLYLNTGGASGGYMADNTNSNLPRSNCSETAVVLDINGDTLKDIYIGKNGGNSTPEQDKLLINTGAGVYQDVTPNRVSNDDDWTRTVSAGDVDGDGRLDLFIGNSGQSRIYKGVP